MNVKKTLEAYLEKTAQELEKANFVLTKYTKVKVELSAQMDVLTGLYNTLYPPKPPEDPKPEVVEKKKK